MCACKPCTLRVPTCDTRLQDTYAVNDTDFKAALARSVAAIGLGKLTSGVCSSCGALTPAQVAMRFRAIAEAGVAHAAIWDAPLPGFWWPLVEAYAKGGRP